MVMMPPKAQKRVEALFKAGMFRIKTVGEPGTHGAGSWGVQGEGMPAFAATEGFPMDTHIPKVEIFVGNW